jgi:hypothetical protein
MPPQSEATMTQVAVQRILARRVIARRVANGRNSRVAEVRVSAIPGSVAGTVRDSAWFHLAGGLIKRALASFVWFWNVPILGAEETRESHYLRTQRLN